MSKEISFLAQQVSSEAGYYQDRQRRHMTKVSVTLTSIDESEILAEFTPEEILQVHDRDAFLELIGEEYTCKYFFVAPEDGDQDDE
ncbi:hypothetical protein [Pseudomonas lundensis]|jgi:hypothetical protein|uniref:hypothetical protein n=1 Tax=Pseudomonas lundensis TaxID=86185 RepID=UPI00089DB41A|nr:hypothetical protein [Pseudomonas lundensis]